MKAAIMGYGTIGSGVYEVLDTNCKSVEKKAGEPDVYKRQDYIMSDEYGAKMESLGYGVSSKMTNTEH